MAERALRLKKGEMDRSTRIDDGAELCAGTESSAHISTHHRDVKNPPLLHLRILTQTFSKIQRFCRVIPSQRYCGVLPVLIAVAIARVVIECEGSVGPRVDADFDGCVRMLIGVLTLRSKRKDRACRDENGDTIEGCLRKNLLIAL
jgi:hypothetical protein